MSDDQLDLVFGALADRTRRAILARLATAEASVGDLTALFTMSQPAISKHLKVLEQAGLVSRTRQGTTRLSHLEAAPLKEATVWMADYRTYWSQSYDRLEALLDSLD
jgi:DNA-binding transcriptional ArsR family regulator